MECTLVQRQIFELEDGSLSAAEAMRVREHASACEACGRELRQWERVREGFAALPRARQPRSVVGDAMRAAETRRGWALGFTLHPVFKVAAALGALAIIGSVSGVLKRGDQPLDVSIPPLGFGTAVGAAASDDVGFEILGREHAMFARAGATLDRNVWTVAATEASLTLFDDAPVRTYGGL